MARNVTFKLDEDEIRLLRTRAAERGMSISRFVSEILEDEFRRLERERQRDRLEVDEEEL